MPGKQPTLFVSGSFAGNGSIAREALMHLAPLVGLNVTYKDGSVPDVAAELIEAADYFVLIMGANDPHIQTVQGDTLVESELDFAGSIGKPVVVVLLTVPESIPTQDGDVEVVLPPFTKRLRARVGNQFQDRVFRLSLLDLPLAQVDPSRLIANDRAELVRCACELLHLTRNLDRFTIKLIQPTESKFEQGMRQLVKRFMDRATETEDLLEMEPRAFEHFMRHLYQELGYEVELTPETRDGGKDLVIKTDNGNFLIELKRWRSHRVGIKVIERLESAMSGEDTGAVMTTSGFTDEVQLRLNRCGLGGPNEIMYLVEAFREGSIGSMMKDPRLSSAILPKPPGA